MQAGDKLEFVRPFSDKPEEINARQEYVINETFIKTCVDLLQGDESLIRSIERLEDHGFVTVYEKPFIIPAQDGSYLHILLFGHQDDKGHLDFNLCVTEHDNSQRQLGGHLYSYDPDGLVRTGMAEEDELEEGENPHFSVLESYMQADMVAGMQLSANDMEREMGDTLHQRLEELASIELWERDMARDARSQPTLQEIVSLSKLMKQAIPIDIRT